MEDLDKTREELIGELQKLRKKEELLRIFIRHIPDILWVKDGEGRYILCNEVFENVFGNKEEDVLGKTDYDFFTKEVADFYGKFDKKAIFEGKPSINEEYIKFAQDNREVLFETVKTPMYDNEKNLIGVLGLARDISERKRVEEELRVSEKKLDLFFSQSLDGFFFMMLDKPVKWDDTVNKEEVLNYVFSHQRITKINDAMLSQYGAKLDEFLGKTPGELFGHDVEYGKKVWREFFDNGKLHIDTDERRMDGTPIWVEGDYICIYDNQNNITGHFGIQRDITERKQIEEALILNESRYNAYINSSSDMVFLKDENLNYIIVNEPFASFFEIDKNEVIGKCDLFFLTPDAAEICKLSDMQVLNSNQLVITDEHLKGKILTTHKFKVPIGNGKFGVGGTIRDVTEQRMAKAQLVVQAEELRELNATKDKFFSIVSHDLRSPFQAFLGLTKIIADELPNLTLDEIQKMASGMKNSAENLSNLLENLLVWSQTQRGVIKFDPTKINLCKKVEAIIGFVKEVADNKNITVKSEIGEEINIYADEQMFESLVNNLLINALKFSHRNGEILVKANQNHDNTVQIAVKDNGIGMNKNILENLFRLGAQENRKGTEGEPSTGLGLIICKEYIEKHNGSIWAESSDNEGSTFYFTLPSV
jgi:PAS domain S-box-containing protein